MTDCPNGNLRDLLPDLLHDRLMPDARQVIEAHVVSCAQCREELTLLRDMRVTLHRPPALSVGSIVAAIPAYRAPARRSRVAWRAAAAITLIAAGGTSVALVQRGGALPSDSAHIMTVDSPRPEVTRELALASGTDGGLSDVELSSLLAELESLDAMLSVDVENATHVTPAAPDGDVQ